MKTPVLWRRPDLQFPRPFDTIFFDIDGVLIYTIESFHATDIAVAEYVAGTIHGLDWGQHAGNELLTQEDVEAFKQAGGYNNDWDMCYLLASLATARLREWQGTPLAIRSTQEWAELSRVANLQGHGGREWVDTVLPASARLDYRFIGDLYHEYYWGAAEMKKRFGHESRYLPDEPGLVHLERMLFKPDFPARLREAGIQHFGLITGRVGPEVDSAIEHLEAYCGERWWEVVVPADICAKPNPAAMRMAIKAVGAGGGLFIGDTADDHDFVRYYRAEKTAREPAILGAMLVSEHEVETYKQRGADFIVSSVEDLLWCLPEAVKE
ncbi:MAG TPA: HAD family hydrolase [Ktedonosporobacter sp.]|nr:HAD family hydrolase [Ktedonosporobacter sp.]